MTAPRAVVLSFSIACNRFAPIATEAEFTSRTWLASEVLWAEARAVAPRIPGELRCFVAEMEAAGPCRPMPIVLALAEPNGPLDQAFFHRLNGALRAGQSMPRRALPVDDNVSWTPPA